MSANETLDERKDNKLNEKYEYARKRDWAEFKKAAIRSRKASRTAILFILLIAFTLAVDTAPFPYGFRDTVLYSWQFKSIVIIAFTLGLYRIWTSASVSDSVSFVELDERNRFEKSRSTAAPSTLAEALARASANEVRAFNGNDKTKNQKSRKAVSGFDFVEHMRSIIESLDYQIDYAEEKASLLLEAGRNFVRGGITLYVVSIVVWQVYLYYINFALNAGVIVGMASTTVIFLIMEFLGAWYLKQYRHYGDSAFSYMKVRSSYNKYMLAYCAVLEFTTDDLPKAKEDLLRVLAESEKWPELKDINSNDFNYMLQSIESMGTIFEKLKGVFGRGNGTGSPS